MIGAREIAKMKSGAFLINNARGSILDVDALTEALKSGHLAGAAVDVFPTEPTSNADPFQSSLQGLDNVILTPHVGGSTEEAQERIGRGSHPQDDRVFRCRLDCGGCEFSKSNCHRVRSGPALSRFSAICRANWGA